MPTLQGRRPIATVVPPTRRTRGHPFAKWRHDVAATVIAMAGEMGPDELTMRAVAHRMRLQDPQVWRVLPKGRSEIVFMVAADLQARQTKAVRSTTGCASGLHGRASRRILPARSPSTSSRR